MEAVKKESFVPMAFFKKEAYTGSFKGMRYRVIKSEDQFEAVVYPEPYCFEATPDENKVKNTFLYRRRQRIRRKLAQRPIRLPKSRMGLRRPLITQKNRLASYDLAYSHYNASTQPQ